MFDSFDRPKNSIFKAGIIGFITGALILGSLSGIAVALSEDAEARYYSLVAAMGGAFMGSIIGAVIGIAAGAAFFTRHEKS